MSRLIFVRNLENETQKNPNLEYKLAMIGLPYLSFSNYFRLIINEKKM